MSFFAAGTAIAGALGAGAVGSAVVGAGAAYVGNKLVNKASSGSSSGSVGSLPNKQLDIDKIISDSRLAAADNYKNSLALEAAQNPGQAAFRNAATEAAIAATARGGAPGYTGFSPVAAREYTGTEQGNTLLSESADSILSQLRLGSNLPADVQSAITRAALSKAGQAGLAGSYAGRGLVARDIGTNSLALLNSRQQQALQAGSLLEQIGLGRANFGMNSALQSANLGLQVDRLGLDQYNAGTNSALQFKSLADSFALPESGLSPGGIASLYVGENNALNQVNQNQFAINQQNANNRAAQLNQLLGFGTQVAVDALKKKKTGVLDIGTLPTTTVDVGYGTD